MSNNKPLEKNSFLKFFEIYKDKFIKILGLNAIFFVVCLVLFLVIFFAGYLVNTFMGGISNLAVSLLFLPLILLAPLVSAIIKMCRDYVREVPGFFLEDFKNAFKSNFKQSIITGIIQYVLIWLLIMAIYFYYSISPEYGLMRTIGLGVCIFAAVVLVIMSYYVYMMIVTLYLKLKEIYKNAAIFTFLCLIRNVLLTVILVVWIALAGFFAMTAIYSQNGFVYGFFFAFIMTLFFGFIFYTVAFFTYPPIKKYVLDPYYEQHPEQSSASVTGKVDASKVKQDFEQEEKELPEFVYHNGKMVHRSAFEQEQMFTDVSEDE